MILIVCKVWEPLAKMGSVRQQMEITLAIWGDWWLVRDPSVLCFIWGIMWYGTRRQSDYSSIGIISASESVISKAYQVLSSVWCENSLNHEIQKTTSETCDLLCDWDSFLFSILSFPDRYSHKTLSSSLIILIMFEKCLFNTCVCCWVARDCIEDIVSLNLFIIASQHSAVCLGPNRCLCQTLTTAHRT